MEPDPSGCAGCNSRQVLPWLDARRLVALNVTVDAPGAFLCETCGKAWWVVSLDTAESPTEV